MSIFVAGSQNFKMKLAKISILIIWICCAALFVVGALTPLSFTNRYLLYFTFFIAFNGIFALSYLLTSFISLKPNKVLLALVASLALMATYEWYPKSGSNWETKEVLYREKSNLENVIAFQRNDLGAFGFDHRTVQIIAITPLFQWIKVLKKIEVNDEWVEVNEQVNEIGTKEP